MTDTHTSGAEPTPEDYADVIGADDEPPPPPRASRRRKLPIASLVLALLAAFGLGFFAGVRVEKNQVTPTASGGSSVGATRGAAGARGGNASPSPGAHQNGGFRGGAGGGGAAGTGAASIVGTIANIDGQTLYVTDQSGDTVKVTTSDGTTVTKTTTGTVKDLNPGETVVIRAVAAGSGVYAAQSVSEGTGGFAGFAGRGGGGFGGGEFGGGRNRPAPSPSAAAAN
jgi:hypothetical protein